MTHRILDDKLFQTYYREGVVERLEKAQHILMEAREGDRDGDFRSLIAVIGYLKKDFIDG